MGLPHLLSQLMSENSVWEMSRLCFVEGFAWHRSARTRPELLVHNQHSIGYWEGGLRGEQLSDGLLGCLQG